MGIGVEEIGAVLFRRKIEMLQKLLEIVAPNRKLSFIYHHFMFIKPSNGDHVYGIRTMNAGKLFKR